MSEATTNGSSSSAAPALADWQSWTHERAVARSLNVTQTFLRRSAASQGIQPFKAPDGTNRYSAEQITRLRTAIESVRELADDDDAPAPAVGQDSFVRQLVESLKQAQAHNERLLGIICGPVERMLNSYDVHQERLDARINKLEQDRDAAATNRETAVERAHERELETRMVTASMERKQKLFDQVAGRLPTVFEALETSWGLKDPTVSKVTKATFEFLKVLDPMQLKALVSDDVPFLTPEQRAGLRKVLDAAGIEIPKDEPVTPAEDPPAQEPEQKEGT